VIIGQEITKKGSKSANIYMVRSGLVVVAKEDGAIGNGMQHGVGYHFGEEALHDGVYTKTFLAAGLDHLSASRIVESAGVADETAVIVINTHELRLILAHVYDKVIETAGDTNESNPKLISLPTSPHSVISPLQMFGASPVHMNHTNAFYEDSESMSKPVIRTSLTLSELMPKERSSRQMLKKKTPLQQSSQPPNLSQDHLINIKRSQKFMTSTTSFRIDKEMLPEIPEIISEASSSASGSPTVKNKKRLSGLRADDLNKFLQENKENFTSIDAMNSFVADEKDHRIISMRRRPSFYHGSKKTTSTYNLYLSSERVSFA
jgi:hypothetical protein